jgi:hypothetical protein
VGARTVGSYRLYRVTHAGRLELGRTFEAEHDAAAIERAAEFLHGDAAHELWGGGRLVGRFSKIGRFAPHRG